MRDPIQYLCEIDNPELLRKEAPAQGVRILSERVAVFNDGSKVQFTVEVDGVRGFLVPASNGAMTRQRAAGRYLKPYNWVTA